MINPTFPRARFPPPLTPSVRVGPPPPPLPPPYVPGSGLRCLGTINPSNESIKSIGPIRTIAQNIAYGAAGAGNGGGGGGAGAEASVGGGGGDGKTNTALGGGVSMDKVVEAAELANAKDFVEQFPDG